MLTALLATLLVQAAPPAQPALVAQGTIAVARTAPAGRRPAPAAVFEEAVETALNDAGFTAIPDVAHARHVATVAITRTAHGAVAAKASDGGGPSAAGGTLGGNSVGAGVSIGLPSNKTRVGQLVATELTLTISRRDASAPVWEGRAVTHQITGTRGDDPAAVAKKLSEALMRNFGGTSGVLISVP